MNKEIVKIIGPCSKYIDGQGWTTEIPVDKLAEQGFYKSDFLDSLVIKEIPRKVISNIEQPKNRIVGYCPNCDGTVDIRLSFLVRHKGHRCSWCGQAIDLTGVETDKVVTSDTCACCGAYLPEGYGQVCKECLDKNNIKDDI